MNFETFRIIPKNQWIRCSECRLTDLPLLSISVPVGHENGETEICAACLMKTEGFIEFLGTGITVQDVQKALELK